MGDVSYEKFTKGAYQALFLRGLWRILCVKVAWIG
jgi:hypothetical protein